MRLLSKSSSAFRTVEHDQLFRGRIDSTLADNQLSELENLGCLIKF